MIAKVQKGEQRIQLGNYYSNYVTETKKHSGDKRKVSLGYILIELKGLMVALDMAF